MLSACSGETSSNSGTTVASVETADIPLEPSPEAIADRWIETLPGQFRSVVELPEAEFIAAWQDHLDQGLDRIEGATGEEVERGRQRLLYGWASGRELYPSRHANINPDYKPSDSYNDYLDQLDLNDESLLGLAEYNDFLLQLRNGRADALINSGDESLNDGTRHLTAKRIVNRQTPPGAVRCFLERDALTDWLENYEADGLTSEPEQLAEACPGSETDSLLDTVQEFRAARDGHPIAIYKSVEGHDLEAHIFLPEDADGPVPAVVWFHGGGWFTGSWNWCGACRYFKEEGLAVVQIEYRITGRHGSAIPESYADARDAVAWVRENASEYGLDPERIVSAGFSAGGHLAMATATLADGPGKPDLAISISGCMDLTDDGYLIGQSRGYESAFSLSPLSHVSADLPPAFLASAQDDPLCLFETATEFVTAAREAGARVEFHEEDGGEHFFLRDPERAARTRSAMNDFLKQHGFLTGR